MAFSFSQPSQPPQQQQSGLAAPFSFGASNAGAGGSNAAKPALSLFGQPAQPASSAPSFSFGAPAAAATTSQPFSFGVSAPAASSAPSFGFNAPAQTGGFSFGSTQPAQTAAQPFAGFGQSQQPQQPASNNPLAKFQASAPAPAPATLGAQPQPPASNKARFEDLPEALRNDLLQFEGFIQSKTAVYEDLKAKTMGEDITKSRHLIADLETEVTHLKTTLTTTYRTISALRTRVEASHKDRAKISRIVDAHRTPTANQTNEGAKSVATFPYDYFSKRVDEMATQLTSYKTAAEQIRSQLAHHDPDQVKAILPTLRHQNQLTLALASKIASLHEEMQQLESQYLQLWRDKTGSVRNVFDEARSRAKAGEAMDLDALAIR